MKHCLTVTILVVMLTDGVSQYTGEQLFSAGRYEEALQAFQLELQSHPDSIRALTNLGCTLHRLGKYDEAMTAFQKAIDTKAEPAAKARAYYNLGNLHYSLQRRKEAIEAYKAALRLNSRDSLAKYNLEIALKERPPQPPSPSNSPSPQSSSAPPSPQMSQSEADQILEAARQNERGPAFKGNRQNNYFNTMVKRDW